VSAEETFRSAVERCLEIPQVIRAAAERSSVEEHSFEQSYIDFLDTQIHLSPRGPEWSERLKRRRESLLPFTGRRLLRSTVQAGTDNYTVEVDPEAGAVVYWERYEGIRT
jgi:hypothetical protein